MAATLTGRIALEGAETIRRAFADLGKGGEAAFKQIKDAGNSVGFDKVQQAAQALAKDLEAAGKSGETALNQVKAAGSEIGLDKVQEAARTLTKDLEDVGQAGAKAGTEIAAGMDTARGSILSVIEGFAGVAVKAGLAVAGVATAVSSALSAMGVAAATAANEIDTAAKKLQATTDVYQKLIVAAAQAGVAQKEAASGVAAFSDLLDKHREAVAAVTKEYDPFNAGVSVVRGGVNQLAEAAKKGAGPFAELGVSVTDAKGKFIASTEALGALADQLKKLGEGKAQDELAKKFGVTDLLPLLKDGKQAFEELTKAAAETGRILTPEQIGIGKALDDAIKELKGAFTDLGSALSATKTQIGLVFAPGRTSTTEFFTEIVNKITEVVDANRPLLVSLAATAIGFSDIVKTRVSDWFEEAGGASGVFSSALLFIVSLAKDIYLVFTSLVGPALAAIGAGFKALTDAINSFFGTNVSTQFVVIAAALGALTGAFGLARGAIGGVISLFTSLGAAILAFPGMFLAAGLGATVFWTELRAGGIAAFNAILPLVPALGTAFRLLFQGNLKGAWEAFAAAGEAAWLRIQAATVGATGPVGSFFRSIENGFNIVRGILAAIATGINTVFGTQLTAGSLGFFLIIAQLAGVFTTLGPLIVAVTAIFTRLGSAFVAVAASAIILARLFPDIGKSWQDVTKAFDNLLRGDFQGALQSLTDAFSGFWENLQKEGVATWAILGIGAASFIRLLTGILSPVSLFGAAFAAAAILILRNLDEIKTAWGQVLEGNFKEPLDRFIASVKAGGDAAWALVVAGAIAAIATIRAAFAVLGLFISGGPFVWAVGGAALLGAAMVLFWDQIVESAVPAFKRLGERFVAEFTAMLAAGVGLWDKFWAQVAQGGEVVLGTLQKVSRALVLLGQGEPGKALDALLAPVITTLDQIKARAQETGQGIKDGLTKPIQDGAQVISNVPLAEFKKIEDGAKATGGSVSESLKGIQRDLEQLKLDAVTGALVDPASTKSALQEIEAELARIKSAADDAFKGLSDTIDKEDFGGPIDKSLGSIIERLGEVQTAFASLKPEVEGARDAIAGAEVTLPAPDTSAWQQIVSEAQRIASEVVAAFTQISDQVLATFGALPDAVQSAASGIEGIVSSMVANISAELDSLMAKIQEVASAAAGAGSGGGGGGGGGFAGGGLVLGAGTGTSDSIFARLSHGEFVIRAAIVREFLPLLRAINEGRIRFADIVGRMPRFADGGLVDALAGSLSGFGPSSLVSSAPVLAGASTGGPALHLHLSSGQVIETRVVRGESALSELHRESLRQQRLSLGRRPKHG